MGKNQGLLAIPLQKVWVVTIVVKVMLSFLAWVFNSPWTLGFWAPLAAMATYIVIGFSRRGEDVGDEKFGDSCYYLGFIFTISSIAFSLFDVPQLDQAGKLKDIAVRFGAAMVSTFFGIIVRIYLVGFKKDTDQSFDRLEEKLITAADEMRGRMELSIEAFRHFEAAVHDATKDVAVRANAAFEMLATSLSKESAAALSQVTSQAREVFVLAATEVQSAARAMSEDLRQCAQALGADVRTRETESHRIVAALQARFDAIILPEDFFSQKLEIPVSNLASTIGVVQDGLRSSATALQDGVHEASGAIEELRVSMKRSNAQLTAVRKQGELLSSLASNMSSAAQTLTASAEAIREQRDLVAELVAGTVARRKSDEETSQELRSSSQQLAAAGATLQLGAEGLQMALRELAELREAMHASAAAQTVVTSASMSESADVAAPVTTVQTATSAGAPESKAQAKGEEKISIFNLRRWR